MAVISKYYLAVEQIAERTGLIDSRYRVADGRFVLSYQDLKLIRFTPEEMISGIGQFIEEVSAEDAKILIAENGYKIGREDKRPEVVAGEETFEPIPTQEEVGNLVDDTPAESETEEEEVQTSNQEEE